MYECIFMFYLIALARTFSTMLNRNGKRRHICLVIVLRGKAHHWVWCYLGVFHKHYQVKFPPLLSQWFSPCPQMQISPSTPLLKILRWLPIFLSIKSSPLVWLTRPSKSDSCWPLQFHVPFSTDSQTHHIFTHAGPSAWNTTTLPQKASLPHLIPVSLPLHSSRSLCAAPELTVRAAGTLYTILQSSACYPFAFLNRLGGLGKANTGPFISVSFLNRGLGKRLWNKQRLPFCFIYT